MEPDRWLGLELRHFLALEAVSRERSFAKAAASLGYTQSAVSQQIAALERIVGQRLVDRPGGPKPVSLTEAGRLLLKHADAIAARVAAAQADLSALEEGHAGTLNVGVFQSVGQRILPEVMRRYLSGWPQVKVSLTESPNDEDLLMHVERGELDLSFTDLPLPEGPFESVELLRDPYVLVVAADSPLAERGTLPTTRELSELDLIGHKYCRTIKQLEASIRQPLNFVFRSDHNQTVQALVASGVGSALVPRLTMDPAEETTTLIELPKLPPRLIGLAWHRDRYRTPAAHAFVETAREVSAELEREPVAA
ncbi:MAG TPA: LysR family transcriptional regulator [Gaiellaceae bacterium]|jgi:DNA-binding transcriptional LysR family regulator|nr:LysR family transcriptional regulator [Gaiellaceae bacterium]